MAEGFMLLDRNSVLSLALSTAARDITVYATRSTRNIILLANTRWEQPQDRAHTADAGPDFHFTKPVDVAAQRLFRQGGDAGP